MLKASMPGKPQGGTGPGDSRGTWGRRGVSSEMRLLVGERVQEGIAEDRWAKGLSGP